MRKSITVAAGLAAAAVLAIAGIAGIASANAGLGSPAGTSTQQTRTSIAISQADAERAAVSAVAGGTVTETRLDVDNGRPVWNVHLSTPNGPVEVKVDAQTGEVRVDDDGALGVDTDPGLSDDDGDDGPGHDANDDHGQGNGDDHGQGHGGDDGPGHN
jgi:uncharacterized membrane protein YkoI